MTLRKEVKALKKMRFANGGTGEISPFIYMTSKTGIYLDVYSLVVSKLGLGAIRYRYHWENHPRVVDTWEALKFHFEVDDRLSFHSSRQVLRIYVKAISKTCSARELLAICKALLGKDVSFLLNHNDEVDVTRRSKTNISGENHFWR